MRKIIPIIIFSLLLGVISFAQEAELPNPGLTPDSPFYFFDTLWEKISLAFTFSFEKKAEKALKFAEEKLAEAKAMAEKGKTQALEKANKKYQEFLGLANQKTKEAKEKGKDVERLVILITEKTLNHQEVLLKVYEKVPAEAKKGIEKAIEVSKKGFEEALKAVSGVKKEELQKKGEEIKIKAEEKIEEEISCKDSLDCPSQMKCENSVCVDVGCIEEGGMGPSAGINPEWLDHLPTECCEGLKSITYSGYYDENCNFIPLAGAPIGVCSNCGNGICEEWEIKCNCPEDCFLLETPVLTDPGISVNKHEVFTVKWTSVSRATKYRLQRDTNPDFSTPLSIPDYWIDYEQNSITGNPNPEVSTTYYYRVKACDDQRCSAWSNVVDMQVIVPSITVISPNGAEEWVIGKTYDIKWNSTGLDKVTIDLFAYNSEGQVIKGFQHFIAKSIDATKGYYKWTIPEIEDYPNYKLRIYNKFCTGGDDLLAECLKDQYFDESDNFFSIIQPSITLTSPNGGEVWEIGKTYNITWTSIGVDKVDLSVNYGTGYLGLGGPIPSTGIDATLGEFSWQIDPNAPYVPGDNLKIKITDDSNSTVYDESDNYFSIGPSPEPPSEP